MGDSFWTSYSDLFVGMSVIFLVLFFFATMRAGMLQFKAALDNRDHEEALKGAVSKETAERSEQQRDQVKKTLDMIQSKKDVLAQLGQRLNDEQNTFNDVLKDQERKEAQLKIAYDTNVKLEGEAKRLQGLKAQLEDGLHEKDRAISSLNQKIQDVEYARAGLERSVTDLNANLRDRDRQVEAHKQRSEELAHELSRRAADVEAARGALAAEQTKTAKLYEDLQKGSRDLEKALADTSHARAEMDLLKQDVTARDVQLSRLKNELGESARIADGLRAEIAGREGKISQLADLTDKLRGDIEARDRRIQAMGVDASEAIRQIGALKKEISDRNAAITSLKDATDELQHRIAQRDARIETIKGDLGLAKTKIQGLNNEIADRNGQIDMLKDSLSSARREVAARENDVARAKREEDDVKGKAAADRAELDGRDRQIARLKRELGDIRRDVDGRDGALNHLKSQLADATRELEAVRPELERYRKLYSDASGGADSKDRKIASLDNDLKKAREEIGELSKLRKEIAGGVLGNLRAHGVDVAVDPESGILTLSMDEVFQFKNGSYEIADASKEKIRRIMPVYANSLFGNAAQAAKIAGVVITGHASPRYKRRFVDPRGFDRGAYIYNLDLSMKRAHQVAAFIFGQEVGLYPHKQELKERTSVAGRGYMDPIARIEGVRVVEPCGRYDCPRSRRVEINFILKENKLAVDRPSPAYEPLTRAPASSPAETSHRPGEYGPFPPPGWNGKD